MKRSEVLRAVAATKSIAARCDLEAKDATVVHNSNKLSLRLLPCDTFARVAHTGREVARFEVELAQALARSEDSPVAALDPRIAPGVFQQDGFAVTLWTHYGPSSSSKVSPDDYADALGRLHAAMRGVDIASPHFTDRVSEAQELVSDREQTPDLADGDRELLSRHLRDLRRSIVERRAPEQLLHGEPHSGNVLSTATGPRFIDLETCCRGPVEFDLAHVPEPVADHYPDVDQALLGECRGLVLGMVAAWRWDREDEFPDGRREGHRFLDAVRAGPPWPTLDT